MKVREPIGDDLEVAGGEIHQRAAMRASAGMALRDMLFHARVSP